MMYAMPQPTRNWLQTIWAQLYNDNSVVQPTEYLHGNLTVGLFFIIVLIAGTGGTSGLNAIPSYIVGIGAAVLICGYPLAALAPRMQASIVFAQAVLLIVGLAALVLPLMAAATARTPLVSFRYLPGLTLCLFVYASMQVEFMGPRSWRVVRPRRIGVALGIASELAMAACLLSRL